MTPHPIDQLNVHEPTTLQNLTVFPLTLSQDAGPAYVSAATAIAQHGLEVTEIDKGGSVPNLLVVNPSELCVLLLDGEELRGAKQNRILNTTVLLAPRSKTLIPVSCTEQGRWEYNSPTFQTAKTVMPTKARRRKTRSVTNQLAYSADFHSNQGEVWEEVAELHAKVGSHSPTGAMADAYARMRRDLDEAMEKVPVSENQYGLIAFIDGKPAGMDLLSRRMVYAELHGQLVQSYAMEALAAVRSGTGEDASAGANPVEALQAKAFLERCAAIEGRDYPSVSLGTDWRFMEKDVVGSGLEAEGAWIHMAYFVDQEEEPGDPGPARHRLPRMSRRSHFRRHPGDEGEQRIY